MKKIIRLYHTIKYLRATQIKYRLFYFLRNKFRKLVKYQPTSMIPPSSNSLELRETVSFDIYNICKGNSFTFIGITHQFENQEIDWNYSKPGKLWNYNLTYFDFLQQENMHQDRGLELIRNFIRYPIPIRGKRMPFPISLRNVNFIKFLSREKIRDKEIDSFIFNQYALLMDNIEYHILGNHLLENGFSLLFGAYYFRDEQLYGKAFEILTQELNEQILKDGAHFELSPMYHQIMLFRVLDAINLLQNNSWKESYLLEFLVVKAKLMLGWLEAISYKRGDIPLFNDSAKGIAPTNEELFTYAKILNLKSTNVDLHESGYRKKDTDLYECIIDVGDIGPDYILGHAHSDTFSFELSVDDTPIIVDTGLSTYESNTNRETERATSSHNTVEVNGKNQSDVWGGFRVARRAKVTNINEGKNFIEAMHDGYTHMGISHSRKFFFEESRITINDILTSNQLVSGIAYLHFHPEINIQLNNHTIESNQLKIEFIGATNVIQEKYEYAEEFNKKIPSQLIKIVFKTELKTKIIIKKDI